MATLAKRGALRALSLSMITLVLAPLAMAGPAVALGACVTVEATHACAQQGTPKELEPAASAVSDLLARTVPAMCVATPVGAVVCGGTGAGQAPYWCTSWLYYIFSGGAGCWLY